MQTFSSSTVARPGTAARRPSAARPGAAPSSHPRVLAPRVLLLPELLHIHPPHARMARKKAQRPEDVQAGAASVGAEFGSGERDGSAVADGRAGSAQVAVTDDNVITYMATSSR